MKLQIIEIGALLVLIASTITVIYSHLGMKSKCKTGLLFNLDGQAYVCNRVEGKRSRK